MANVTQIAPARGLSGASRGEGCIGLAARTHRLARPRDRFQETLNYIMHVVFNVSPCSAPIFIGDKG